MNELARRIQRTYLTLMLGNTLAASFIWGINTLFLLDAGLSNLEAFAANAFFTAGMVLFEVPTGVVADTWGRRVSYLLGTLTLAGSTLLYYLMWHFHAPFWAWAIVSMLIGLGFTFFSGAVDAWLVDALKFADYRDDLESVLGRGQMVAGAAMLGGSVLGGVIAQATSLGVPFLLRVGVLMVMFVVAWRLMRDIGFTPHPASHPLRATREVLSASITYGMRNRPVWYVMLAAPFATGVGIYAFYAMQPLLLELYGDPKAYTIAGLAAALVAGAQIAGGYAAPKIRRLFRKRTTALILGIVAGSARPRSPWHRRCFLARARAPRHLGADLRRRDADPPSLSQRHDPIETASHSSFLRFAHGQRRRRCHPAGPRADRRHLGLRRVAARRRGHPARLGAFSLLQPTPEPAGRHSVREPVEYTVA